MDSDSGTPKNQPAPPVVAATARSTPASQGPRWSWRLAIWIILIIGLANLFSAALATSGIGWATGLGVVIHSGVTAVLLFAALYLSLVSPLRDEIKSLRQEKEQLTRKNRELDNTLAERQAELASTKAQLQTETASRQRADQEVRRVNQELERRVFERTARFESANRALTSDLDEQKKINEALRESEKRFRRLVEIANEGIWTINAEGKTNFVNRAGAELLGFTIPELLGRQPGDVIVTDDMPAGVRRLDLQGKCAAEVLEARMRRKDGRELWMHCSISPITGGQGEYLGALLIFSDITARKRNEQRLQEQADLLDVAQDALVLCDPHLHIISWNEGAARLYGWAANDVIGRDCLELLADQGAPEVKNDILAALKEKASWRGEINQVTKDGRKMTVDARFNMSVSIPGKPGSVLMVSTDITPQKRRLAQQVRDQRMESASNFAIGLTQELNNLLGPVLLSTQMLRSEQLQPDARGLLATIETSAARTTDLLRQALIFARGVEGERTLLHPTHLLKEMAEMAREIFPRNIQVLSEVQGDVWNFKGDSAQIHQVLLRLCVRARDVMPSGGTLWLMARNLDLDPAAALMRPELKPGPFVLIQIQDSGPGLPRAVLERLFEPFFTAKEDGAGAGLGLAAALGIIKSHGGTIEVQSRADAGTTFDIFIPAAAAPAGERSTSVLVRPWGHGELILMVEEEAALRDVAKRTLKKSGYEVIAAADGVEALGILAEHQGRVRLVFTNIVTPSMDGTALARAARKIAPQVKIIASSGLGKSRGQTDKMAALQSLGVSRLLAKPYSAEELLQAVRDELAQGAPPNS